MTDEAILHKAHLRRQSERAATIVRALTLALVVFLVIVVLGALFSLLSLQRRLADCTDPGGTCYKRSQERTEQAVQEIVGGIKNLETQRAVTSNQLKQGIKELCEAQHVSCPSVMR